MFLAGPIWIGLLLHFLMLVLVIQAAFREISRVWLIVPMLYYGGGYALHLHALRLAEAEAAKIARANAAQSVQVETPFSYTGDALNIVELLEHFRVAWEQSSKQDYRDGGRLYSVVVRTDVRSGAACDLPTLRENDPFAPWLVQPYLFPSEKAADKTRQCLVRQMIDVGATPMEDPRYSVKRTQEFSHPPSRFVTPDLFRWTATDLRSNRVITEVVEGDFYTLPAVQTIVVGCALDSGTPAWRCGIELMGGSNGISVGHKRRTDGGYAFTYVSDPETSPAYALGKALGLTPRTPTDH
ncbi:hypothetical protein [Rhodoblastus sp.]|uniref:hypothetical protein n=1 Tax=Rhodoblastus sp. TaxID=1962975 RepID=UPI003F9A5EE1